MTGATMYDALRALADTWGLAAMALVFVALCLWPFRPGARGDADQAARSIFQDDRDDA